MNEFIVAIAVCVVLYKMFKMNKHTRENIRRWFIQLRMDSKAGVFDVYYGTMFILAVIFGGGSLVYWVASLW